MKKFLFALFLCAGLLLSTHTESHAQSKNAFYVELLGNGLIFSANYDFRFNNTSSWGARAGLGYIGSVEGDGGVVTVPLMINNLLGKDGKYFEVGAGITILGGTGDFVDDLDSEVIGTMSFKYRRQPEDGGFMWHVGLTPVLAEGVFIPYWVGIGIGYSW